MKFNRFDKEMKKAKKRAAGLMDEAASFCERNALELAYTGICAAVAIPAGVIAVKATSTAVAVVGGLVAVSYGIGAIGGLCWVVANEVTDAPRTIDGTARRVS